MKDKLDELNPWFRHKIEHGVLPDLRGKGWEPVIAEAWRDPEIQLLKFRQKRSKVMWGFHCATAQDGKADALACDIVDHRWFWRMPLVKRLLFRKHLMSSCKAHGLTSGAQWVKSFPPYGDWAHVEAAGITIAEAKAGERPVA